MVAAVMTSSKELSTGGAHRARTPLSNEVREGVNGSGRGAVTTPVTGTRSHGVTPGLTRPRTAENQSFPTVEVTMESQRDISTGVDSVHAPRDSDATPTVTDAGSHAVTEHRS